VQQQGRQAQTSLSVLYGHGVSVKKLNKLEILDGSSAIAGSTCMAAPWA
jgi:hypothetical protein